MLEYRVVGPPGVGKTTWLTRQIEHAAEKHGPDAVIATSFTKAAAVELTGRMRKSGVSGVYAGTMHSLAYRLLEARGVAESELQEWNEYAARMRPQYKLSGASGDVDEPEWEHAGNTTGDELYAIMNRLRAMMVPRELWPGRVQAFAAAWRTWKAEIGLPDFTDLLELCLDPDMPPPCIPAVVFVDECQDLCVLELAVARKWAADAEKLVVVGDPWQAIYGFKGAEPRTFLEPAVPEDQRIVLRQSWRVPRTVLLRAVVWVAKCAEGAPPEYYPRDADGAVEASTATWKDPTRLLDEIERALRIPKRTIMLLASCGYMLGPLLAMLRKRGVPFCNPYRRKRGDWNPLARGGSVRRLLAFAARNGAIVGERAAERHVETYGNLWAWAEHLRAETFAFRGQKADLGVLTAEQLDEPVRDVLAWFAPEHHGWIRRGDVDGWAAALLSTKGKAFDFPRAVLRERGVVALREQPRVIVGTVHSVKGGEASSVAVFPDLSAAGMGEWMGQGTDAIRRLFYVAMTRAKERLVLCSPCGSAVRM